MSNFLCMCEGGNVRSVGLAFQLKEHGQQALACGWRFTNPKTLNMLCGWADYIVVMQAEMAKYIPEAWKNKVRIVDVGPDNYGYAFHPQLQGFLKGVVDSWAANYRKFLF